MKRGFLDASWSLVGITVGAGILGIPFVLQRAGFLTGLLVIFIIGLLMTLVKLYLGEIVLSTKGKHQLSGYAEKYLGKKIKWVMFAANSLSIYGALTAYIIGAGQALYSIFFYDKFIFSLVFFLFFSVLSFFSIKVVSKSESFLSPLKILFALLLGVILVQFIDLSNLSEFNIKNILIPYGVIVFAFTGISAIPTMADELSNQKDLFNAIIYGMLITVAIYVLFSFSVVGSLGNYVGEVATSSMIKLGNTANIFSNIFAFLAMSTAFLGLSYALKENYILDFKLGNFLSWFLVIIIPLLIFLSKFGGFIKILEISGAIGIGVILILIILMHSNLKRDRIPEYRMPKSLLLKVVIVSVLFIGIIYEILTLIGFI